MNTIAEKAAQLERDFTVFDDWMDRYNYLIEIGKTIPQLDEKYKTDAYLIKGCQSRVWLYANLEEGLIHYTADSDAVITRGIAGLLIRVLSGNTPQEILDADLQFIERIGLQEHLSPTRSNGLVSMIKQMKLFALAYQTKLNGAANKENKHV